MAVILSYGGKDIFLFDTSYRIIRHIKFTVGSIIVDSVKSILKKVKKQVIRLKTLTISA